MYFLPIVRLGLLKQKLTESLEKNNETLEMVIGLCNTNKVSLTDATPAITDESDVCGGSSKSKDKAESSPLPDISTIKISNSERFVKLQKKAHDNLVRYRNETRVIVDELTEILAKGNRHQVKIAEKEKRIEKINERLKVIRNK